MVEKERFQSNMSKRDFQLQVGALLVGLGSPESLVQRSSLQLLVNECHPSGNSVCKDTASVIECAT
eukprot:268885-Amphidinium_carterae.1